MSVQYSFTWSTVVPALKCRYGITTLHCVTSEKSPDLKKTGVTVAVSLRPRETSAERIIMKFSNAHSGAENRSKPTLRLNNPSPHNYHQSPCQVYQEYYFLPEREILSFPTVGCPLPPAPKRGGFRWLCLCH